jgi:hypothetical protein
VGARRKWFFDAIRPSYTVVRRNLKPNDELHSTGRERTCKIIIGSTSVLALSVGPLWRT